MLDLKAKLLAAGLVTAEQVKKVEDDESARKQRAKDARDARESKQRDGDRRGPRGGPREGGDGRRGESGNGAGKGASTRSGAGPRRGAGSPGSSGARRPDPDDPDEKEARREHQLVEAERWRKRLGELAAAGKAEQYEAVRGWVLRHRLDSKQISEAAVRFHFMRADGTLSHLTVEPDVKERLASGEAALVAFMGFNGLEHTVVPRDLALDIQQVKPEWLRALAGVTDQPDAAAVEAAEASAVEASAAEASAAAAASVDALAAAPGDASTSDTETPAGGDPVSGT